MYFRILRGRILLWKYWTLLSWTTIVKQTMVGTCSFPEHLCIFTNQLFNPNIALTNVYSVGSHGNHLSMIVVDVRYFRIYLRCKTTCIILSGSVEINNCARARLVVIACVTLGRRTNHGMTAMLYRNMSSRFIKFTLKTRRKAWDDTSITWLP